MSNALRSYEAYARLIFDLLAGRVTIERHTLAVYTTSRTVGITRGEVVFRSGLVLQVFEQVDFVRQRILKYFYAVTEEGKPLWWYDSMPHPGVAELQSTHPHHKHIPPDIKHHRIPSPGYSFTESNLPLLIAEIEAFQQTLIAKMER